MKKILLTSVAGVCLVFVTSIAANGQLASVSVEPSKKIAKAENSEAKSSSNMIDASSVNQKAIKDVARSFKNLSDERWFSVTDGYVVKFSSSDVNYQVAYNKRGNRTYTIRNYDEWKLPTDIRHTVRSSYYDHSITLVQEITMPANNLTYIIHLEGKKDIIKLRMHDGDMEEWQKFVKSN